MENPWLIYSVQEAFREPAALEGGEESGPSWGDFQCFIQDQFSLPGNFQIKGHSLPLAGVILLSRLNVTSVIST